MPDTLKNRKQQFVFCFFYKNVLITYVYYICSFSTKQRQLCKNFCKKEFYFSLQLYLLQCCTVGRLTSIDFLAFLLLLLLCSMLNIIEKNKTFSLTVSRVFNLFIHAAPSTGSIFANRLQTLKYEQNEVCADTLLSIFPVTRNHEVQAIIT